MSVTAGHLSNDSELRVIITDFIHRFHTIRDRTLSRRSMQAHICTVTMTDNSWMHAYRNFVLLSGTEISAGRDWVCPSRPRCDRASLDVSNPEVRCAVESICIATTVLAQNLLSLPNEPESRELLRTEFARTHRPVSQIYMIPLHVSQSWTIPATCTRFQDAQWFHDVQRILVANLIPVCAASPVQERVQCMLLVLCAQWVQDVSICQQIWTSTYALFFANLQSESFKVRADQWFSEAGCSVIWN